MIRSFVISRIFPAALMGAVTVIKLLNQNIPNEYIATAITLLIILTILRWTVEHNLLLMAEYRSLIPYLKNFEGIRKVVNHQLKVRNCWRYYFNEKQSNLNKEVYDFNKDLNKLIHNPYKLLLKKNVVLVVKEKFNKLVEENYYFYRDFLEMINTENICKNSFSYDEIKKAHENLVSALKQYKPETEFSEIRDSLSNVVFMPLEEPKQ